MADRADQPPFISPCVMCNAPFRQGDRGVLIGHVTDDGRGELRWAHMWCIAANMLGEQRADELGLRDG